MAVKVHNLILLSGIDDDLKLNAEISKIYDEIISEELKKEFKEALSNEGNEENCIQDR